jgi:hypothetical protein
MTTCLPKYTPVTFGWTLHPECAGCKLKHPFGKPVSGETKQAPNFDEKCPMKEEKK